MVGAVRRSEDGNKTRSEREEALARAMRDNLKRRKARQRALARAEKATETPAPSEDEPPRR